MRQLPLFAITLAAAALPLPNIPPSLLTAFAADGFNVTQHASAPHGGFALAARSTTSSINGNASAMKPAYYTTGSAYDMGYALGAVAEPSVSILTSTYLDHIVPSLIDEDLDLWLQNSTLAPVYDLLIALLADLLINDSEFLALEKNMRYELFLSRARGPA
jgi:hypothetical protein